MLGGKDREYYDGDRIEKQSQPPNIGDARVRPTDDSDTSTNLATTTHLFIKKHVSCVMCHHH